MSVAKTVLFWNISDVLQSSLQIHLSLQMGFILQLFCEHRAKSFKHFDRHSSKGQFRLHDVNWFCFPLFLISAQLSRDSIIPFLHEMFRRVLSKLRCKWRNLLFLVNRLRKEKAVSYRKHIKGSWIQYQFPSCVQPLSQPPPKKGDSPLPKLLCIKERNVAAQNMPWRNLFWPAAW